jgi:hypothetical protein
MLAVHNLEKLKTWRPAWPRCAEALTRAGFMNHHPLFEQEHTPWKCKPAAARRHPAAGLGRAERPRGAQACIPGCDKVEATGDNQYAVGVAVKIGPVSAKFAARSRWRHQPARQLHHHL